MEILKRRKVKGVIYDSKAEFFSYNHDVVLKEDWREGLIGDWVVADDDRIIQILDRKRMSNGQEYIRTICGAYTMATKEMTTEMRDSMYSFGGNDYKKSIKIRKKISSREKLFVIYLVSGMNADTAYMNAFPTDKRHYAREAASRLLTTERVKMEIENEISDLLDGMDLSKKDLLKIGKQLLDGADYTKDKIAVWKIFLTLAGLTGDNDSMQINAYTGLTGHDLERIAGVKKIELIESGDQN